MRERRVKEQAVSRPQHAIRFPGETDEYRGARNALLDAEIRLRSAAASVAEQRRALPLGGEISTDYSFQEIVAGATVTVSLSQLFEPGKDTLLLYSFMFIPGEKGLPLEVACPSCTSIIAAVDGEVPDITQRINIAICAKAPIAQLEEHARTRGWRHIRRLSSAHTSYNRDYHAEDPDGRQKPIATVFVRRAGRIHHFWSSELYFTPNEPGRQARHVDFMWPLWNIFDLTPEGRGTSWGPKLDYG